jgi:uncharacterized protein YndB with AHSA1/START domain
MTMTNTGALQITTPSEREIRFERSFSAPRQLVYDAYTKPELVKRWLGAMPGWSWVVCEMDVRVGGQYRWAWRGPDGAEMGMGGTYREIVPSERLVNTERFDQSWYDGDAVVTVVFSERGGKTTVTTDILYVSKEVRDGVLQSPAADGMEMGYQLLDALFASESAS